MNPGRRVMAVIVTYHPDSGLQSRIAELVGQVDAVLIVDNTPGGGANDWQFLTAGVFGDKVKLRAMGRNVGVAAALNIGVEEARLGGFGYLLTLDQDSSLPATAVERLLSILTSATDIAVVGPLFHEEDTGRRSYVPVKRSWLVPTRIQPDTGIYDVYTAITSGSLYRVDLFADIGTFLEEYFIDGVDNEHCLRILTRRFRVVVSSSVDIGHSIGKRTAVIRWGIGFSPPNYPPVRHYYMTRNRIFLYKKYSFKFPMYMLYDLACATKVFARVLFAEDERREKLRMMARGFLDGLRGRGGVYSKS